ncbi:nucleotide kinase domain-containing protein [Spirulina sp. 06S082]|uniref:nucleotide kinase domain-containing protein n=1 Tax=Spirulina sp. 06S082 TaxID=3110248 RepID=UPI002B1EE839|nr:nucleotide kinase domain-containing protein [Spirulina sp. 06S082]MEA5467880.1 nucleotide kinase domain-containing protein [Spirulina sp. 06S082]
MSNTQKQSQQLIIDFDKPIDSSNTKLEISSLIPNAKSTIVFDSYWHFAVERQNIFFKRFEDAPLPWTTDPILEKYKFTNAYRASDRTSLYLIRNVIYREDLPSTINEVFFRILLFKLFNKIETWQLLEKEIGHITFADYTFERYNEILTKAMDNNQSIYSAAYIMPSGGKTFGYQVKHRNHLKLIERMMADELPKKLQDTPKMEQGFKMLREYPTIGNFLAYQFITDINYSEITDWDEMDFVVPGPGALDGISKCFTDIGERNESDIIKDVTEIQEEAFKHLGLDFRSLWGRKLQPIDCQNLFCEVDKYARVKHQDILGRSGRSRIKQKYIRTQKSIDYWYPPKWQINSAIQKEKGKK